MSCHGFEFYLNRCSHKFLPGLMLAVYIISCQVQVLSARCDAADISLTHQHCEIHPDGIRDLDCFGNYRSGYTTCVWKPGNHAAENYSLIIQQPQITFCQTTTHVMTKIRLYNSVNFTVEVFETSRSTNCTKAVFKGSSENFWRCDPPNYASFSRHAGRIVVNAKWKQEKYVENYLVRYKALGSLLWTESPVSSKSTETYTVEHLNSSLFYTVQIQCVKNKKCSQCLWSDAYNVPPELTKKPVIVKHGDTITAERRGCRMLYLAWKYPPGELHDGYSVTISKASGEGQGERIRTTQPEIRLILSYSAYHLNISAINNASTSPPLSQVIPAREDMPGLRAGKVNITVHNETAFTVHWEDNLIDNYVCYAVEWMKKGYKAVYKSFYEDENNNRTLSSLLEPLEPYKRYNITLHTRPYKETCNLKYINNSESTYGSTQFYLREGSPISAPADIVVDNVTLNSVMLQWSSIPEDDIRGFLLGYKISYTEYQNKEMRTEKSVTVGPARNRYKLAALNSSTVYKVQISGFTVAGEGVRSKACLFTTKQQRGHSDFNTIITVSSLTVVATMLSCGYWIIKRANGAPAIPNPGKSNAVQQIYGPLRLNLTKSMNTLKMEEWEMNSLQIVEKEEFIAASSSSSTPPLLNESEDEGDSSDLRWNGVQISSAEAAGDVPSYVREETFTDVQQMDLEASPFAFSSGYTTMEMFQQVMPQGEGVLWGLARLNQRRDLTEVEPGLE